MIDVIQYQGVFIIIQPIWFVVFAPNNEYILESGIQRLAYARYSRLLNILNALRIWLFTELMMFVHAINVNKRAYIQCSKYSSELCSIGYENQSIKNTASFKAVLLSNKSLINE